MLNRKMLFSLFTVSVLSVSMSAQAAPASTDSASNAPVAQAMNTARININTADANALETIKGLGAAKAQSIVEYRGKHGNFKSIDELENVPGIGPKLAEKIKGQVTV